MTFPRPSSQSGQPPIFVCLLVLVLMCGCSTSTVPTQPSSTDATAVSSAKSPAGPPAAEVLEKMRDVYRNAKTYTDNTSVVFHAVVRRTGGETETAYTRASVAFERPNRLHVTYQRNIASPQEERFEVVSNGVFVRSTAKEIPLQIHEAIAPLELSTKNFIPEPALRGALLESALENTLPQLALLLVSVKEQAVFPGEDQARMLGEAELDGKLYHRLEMPSPAGKRVLWVDQEQFTMRRMEVPIDDQKKQINARNQYSQFSVWIDFESVTIDPEIESATFHLAIPEKARRVRRFISPPQAGPPDFLGKPVGKFNFTTLEGESVTPETVAEKVVILIFWSTRCPPCKSHTPVLNEVYQQFKDSDEVAFYAVSTDNPAVSNDVVAQTLTSWGGEMPVVRDLKSSGYHDLNVQQTPTLLLVDRKSQLQSFQIGTHRSPQPVINAIERLVDGEDLVAADREKYAEYLLKHQEMLEAAAIEDSIVEVEVVRPEIAPRQLPDKLHLKQRWQTTTEQVGRPGDIQVVAEGLLVLDGGEAIVELDVAGKVVGRHELPKHDEQAGGFLRSWSNDQGERWTLASGVGWQQVYVFDDHWKSILSFPDERHSGIGDVLFTDLTGSGTPVMHVGYWGGLGVHGGSLDGRQLWSNRKLDHVVQIGVGPTLAAGNRTAWCSSTRGTLLQLGADGKVIQESYIEGQALMYFASQPAGENHCGLAVGKVGQYTAVGFDSLGIAAWEYKLPPGEYVSQLPRIQSVRMPGGDYAWLVVAANGSLHWLDATGKLIDRFDYGEILTGVAVGSLGDQPILYLATAKNLTAWQMSAPLSDANSRRATPRRREAQPSATSARRARRLPKHLNRQIQKNR